MNPLRYELRFVFVFICLGVFGFACNDRLIGLIGFIGRTERVSGGLLTVNHRELDYVLFGCARHNELRGRGAGVRGGRRVLLSQRKGTDRVRGGHIYIYIYM